MAKRYRRYRKKRKMSKRRYRRGGSRRYSRKRKYKSGKTLRNIKFGSVKGYGGYKIQSNSILSGGMSPPKIMNTFTNDGVVIRHREYLTDLKLPEDQDFQILKTINLNPGVDLPWLKGIAENWKEYEWHGVLLEYKPLTALATTTGAGAMGSIMIGTHYDMYENAFLDKKEMLNSEYTTSGKPQMTQIHPIECKRSQTPVSRKWIRNGAIPFGADKRLYDHCRIEIASEGIPGTAGAAIGEIWITFEVCLYKPKMVDGTSFIVEQDVATYRFGPTNSISTGSLVPIFKNTNITPPGSELPYIPRETSMFSGHFYPSGNLPGLTNAYYDFDELDITVGDIFRFTIWLQADNPNSTVTTDGAHVICTNCIPVRWFTNEHAGYNFLEAPAQNLPSRFRYQEYYIKIQEHGAGAPIRIEFDGRYAVAGENSTMTWFLIIHKLKNEPRFPED